ncbi:hypothetical protein ACFLZV_05740, partial [Candidatus Margulisiibacteriota bacterium]
MNIQLITDQFCKIQKTSFFSEKKKASKLQKIIIAHLNNIGKILNQKATDHLSLDLILKEMEQIKIALEKIPNTDFKNTNISSEEKDAICLGEFYKALQTYSAKILKSNPIATGLINTAFLLTFLEDAKDLFKYNPKLKINYDFFDSCFQLYESSTNKQKMIEPKHLGKLSYTFLLRVQEEDIKKILDAAIEKKNIFLIEASVKAVDNPKKKITKDAFEKCIKNRNPDLKIVDTLITAIHKRFGAWPVGECFMENINEPFMSKELVTTWIENPYREGFYVRLCFDKYLESEKPDPEIIKPLQIFCFKKSKEWADFVYKKICSGKYKSNIINCIISNTKKPIEVMQLSYIKISKKNKYNQLINFFLDNTCPEEDIFIWLKASEPGSKFLMGFLLKLIKTNHLAPKILTAIKDYLFPEAGRKNTLLNPKFLRVAFFLNSLLIPKHKKIYSLGESKAGLKCVFHTTEIQLEKPVKIKIMEFHLAHNTDLDKIIDIFIKATLLDADMLEILFEKEFKKEPRSIPLMVKLLKYIKPGYISKLVTKRDDIFLCKEPDTELLGICLNKINDLNVVSKYIEQYRKTPVILRFIFHSLVINTKSPHTQIMQQFFEVKELKPDSFLPTFAKLIDKNKIQLKTLPVFFLFFRKNKMLSKVVKIIELNLMRNQKSKVKNMIKIIEALASFDKYSPPDLFSKYIKLDNVNKRLFNTFTKVFKSKTEFMIEE